MSTKDQAIKNMDLTQKLAAYIAKHPNVAKQGSENVTYVAFSAKDEELNEANKKLLESVIKEGRKVIRAVQTNDKTNPWKFFPVPSM